MYVYSMLGICVPRYVLVGRRVRLQAVQSSEQRVPMSVCVSLLCVCVLLSSAMSAVYIMAVTDRDKLTRRVPVCSIYMQKHTQQAPSG